MTSDETESQVQRIARRMNGESISTRDLFDLVLAVDNDANRRHEENVALLENHVLEAQVRDQRLDALEDYRESCAGKVKALLAEEHILISEEHRRFHEEFVATQHPAPRRKGDPEDADYSSDRRVWVMWNIGSKVTNILVAAATAIVVALLNYWWFGQP